MPQPRDESNADFGQSSVKPKKTKKPVNLDDYVCELRAVGFWLGSEENHDPLRLVATTTPEMQYWYDPERLMVNAVDCKAAGSLSQEGDDATFAKSDVMTLLRK